MKLLSLDTSTEACSVALVLEASVIERAVSGTRHSEQILMLVQEVLAEGAITLGQLDGIAFGRGPGSFTSLRIGAGVVQGLAFGANLKVLPVSSLAALAQATGSAQVLAAMDARMHQVYWCRYRRASTGLVEPAEEEVVVDPAGVPLPTGIGWTGAGSGWDVYGSVLKARLGQYLAEVRTDTLPTARAVAELGAAALAAGQALSPEQALPVYIRDNVAVKQGRH
jgi:tRNA threonylcarbamoyladenosine biosynthesis protein TsaB